MGTDSGLDPGRLRGIRGGRLRRGRISLGACRLRSRILLQLASRGTATLASGPDETFGG